jgi:hypothetical protein
MPKINLSRPESYSSKAAWSFNHRAIVLHLRGCLLSFLFMALSITSSAATQYQTTSDLNVRSGPGSKFSSIGIIKEGEEVSVIEESNSTWFKISYEGSEGYVSSKYLEFLVDDQSSGKLPDAVENESSNPNIFFMILGVFFSILMIRSLLKKANRAGTKDRGKLKPVAYKASNISGKEVFNNDRIASKLSTHISKKNDDDNDSIIDVSSESHNIDRRNYLLKHNDVPYWAHHYVYSAFELQEASNLQREFYEVFKRKFLAEVYLDLEGNTNYAFILLFDLLDDYRIHSDILKLESQLKMIGLYYPETKPYASSFLIQKMEAIGDLESVRRLRDEDRLTRSFYNSEYDYWKLGSKYKSKLSLSDEEVLLLNRLWAPTTTFCGIEFCLFQVLKLYISLFDSLRKEYSDEGTSVEEIFLSVADLVARKHFRYRKGSYNYKYCIENTTNDLYANIFKHCENEVRDFYNHSRKLDTGVSDKLPVVQAEYESLVISKVTLILSALRSKIESPDEQTEIELYTQNKRRWKVKFEELVASYGGNPGEFEDSIIHLTRLNKHNPSAKNIFLEASRFIIDYDKITTLRLILCYLSQDVKHLTFDGKVLSKTSRKMLFANNEQAQTFENIVDELLKGGDINAALDKVSGVYAIKRRKIKLDRTSIEEVRDTHSGTVELLNEYLSDQDDQENQPLVMPESVEDIITHSPILDAKPIPEHFPFSKEIKLTGLQVKSLDLFKRNNLSISLNEFEDFSRSHGVFRNQLIESINEVCFDFLDDVLIEEENDFYVIDAEYFDNISKL